MDHGDVDLPGCLTLNPISPNDFSLNFCCGITTQIENTLYEQLWEELYPIVIIMYLWSLLVNFCYVFMAQKILDRLDTLRRHLVDKLGCRKIILCCR